MRHKICDVKVGDRFRKDIGNLKSLSRSIQEIGLLHPIVISEEDLLIAGVRRLEACRMLGWSEIPVTVVNLEDLRKGEIQENLVRKDFTVSEMVAIKRAMEPEVSIGQGKRTDLTSGNLPEVHRTRDILGSYVGVSGKTLRKAEKIVEAAEKQPEKFGKLLEKVDENKTSISHAYTEIRRNEAHATSEPLPEGKYDIFYADPPWKYNVQLRGNPDAHYQTLNDSEICSLEIPVAENAVLFLWATNPKLKEALNVMESWGFTYKTNLVWVKDKIGNGYYFRGQHELLLLGIKGNMPAPTEASRPSSVLHAPRQRHSQKPRQIYDLIEQMYPNRSYLELFARNKREGWTSWGNEL